MRRVLFGGLSVLGAVGIVRGQSYTAPSIIPSADAFVSKDNPNNNYGAAGAGSLHVGGSQRTIPDLYAVQSLVGSERH